MDDELNRLRPTGTHPDIDIDVNLDVNGTPDLDDTISPDLDGPSDDLTPSGQLGADPIRPAAG